MIVASCPASTDGIGYTLIKTDPVVVKQWRLSVAVNVYRVLLEGLARGDADAVLSNPEEGDHEY
jgi:hypothetical protein